MRRKKQWLRNSTGCPSDTNNPNDWDWSNWENWPDCDKEMYPLESDVMEDNMKKVRECNEPFIDRWNDTLEILPDYDDVWFISNGKIYVGMYEPEQKVFCMADCMGVKLEDVRQWKYANLDKQITRYPKEKQVVAAKVKGLPCMITGIFTDHLYDEESGDEVSGLIPDDEYNFDRDRCDGELLPVDWKDVEYWYALPEEPLVILEPVKDNIAVVPTEQGKLNGDEHIVSAPDAVITSDKTCASCDCGDSDCESSCEPCESSCEEKTCEGEVFEDGVKSAIAKSASNGEVIEESKGNKVELGKQLLASYNNDNLTDKELLTKMKDVFGNGELAKDFLSEFGRDVMGLFTDSTDKKEEKVGDRVNKIQESARAEENIRRWYISRYPSDELGENINPDITFSDVYKCLKDHNDIYDFIGVGDSIVRERIFAELAEIENVDYDYIFDLWLDSVNESMESNDNKLTEADGRGELMNELLDDNVRDWYIEEYPDDDLGLDINDSITFRQIINLMNIGSNIYDIIDVGDSVVRERIFSRLSYITGRPYDDFYDAMFGKQINLDESKKNKLTEADEVDNESSVEGDVNYLEDLKKLINGEMVAAIQYEMAFKGMTGVSSSNFSYLQSHFDEHADEEWGHYEDLVDALMQRKSTTYFNIANGVQEALPATEELTSFDCDYLKDFFIRAEENAINAYQEFYDRIEKVDPSLADVIIGIINDEKDHKLDFEKLNMDSVPMGESKKSDGKKLQENNYGWEIREDSIWDALDYCKEALGGEGLAEALAKAMGEDQLKDLLEFICRNYEIEGPFLEGYEDYDESKKADGGKLEEVKKVLKEGDHVRYKGKKYTIDSFLENNQIKIYNESEELIVEANEIKDAVHARMKESEYASYEDALNKLNNGEWDNERFNDAINNGEIVVPNSEDIVMPAGEDEEYVEEELYPEEAYFDADEGDYSFLPESLAKQMTDYLDLID